MVLWKVADLNIGSPFKGAAVLLNFGGENFEQGTFPNAIGSDDCDPVAFTNIE